MSTLGPASATSPTGAPHLDRLAAEVRNFLVANACYWLRGVPRRRPARGMRSRPCSISTTPAGAASGCPSTAGERTRGDRPAPGDQRAQGTRVSAHRAEESTSWPGVTKETAGSGLRLQVEHGVDERLLRYRAARSDLSAVPPQPADLLADVCLQENHLLPISHDEVVHGKGSLLGKIPGHRGTSLATLRAYLATSGATRGSSCSWV